MFTKSTLSKCRAKDPSTCRTHGNPDLRTFMTETLKQIQKLPSPAGFLPREQNRKGTNNDFYETETTMFRKESEAYYETLSREQRRTLHNYSAYGALFANSYLSGGDAQFRIAARSWLSSLTDEQLEDLKKQTLTDIETLDKLFKNQPVHSFSGKVLYRAVPETQTSRDNLTVGKTITFPNYLSTSIDPDYMLIHHYRAKSPRNPAEENITVYEILPKHNGLLIENEGGVGEQEKEVLLNRNTTYRVVDTFDTTYELSYLDIRGIYGCRGMKDNYKQKFTVVQLVEE